MKHVRVGYTGVNVTELGFGAAQIGNLYRATDTQTAIAAVNAAWDEGVRYFDTAPHYGLGLSERRLGSALASRPRNEYAVSTKVGRLLIPNPSPVGSDMDAGGFDVPDTLTRQRDYSRDGILRSLESSLHRMALDRIDIVYVHDPEDFMDTAVREAVPALSELREQGVIGAVGVGMNFVDPLLRFVSETDVDVVMVAGRWTLVDRSAGVLIDKCAARGVAVVAAAPFNSGLLTQNDPADDASFDYGPAPADVLECARGCAQICSAHATELPAAALQFPVRHAAVTSVVAGMRTASQVKLDLSWFRAEIDETLWTELPPPAR